VSSGKTKNGLSEGFSLAELMVALACAAILLTVAVPNIVQLQKEWALWGGARILETSLQWGRMHAITSNSPAIFEIDATRQEFYWTDAASRDRYAGSVRHLPAGIRFIAAPRRSLRFYQHGNAAPGGTYTIAGDTGSFSVIVSPGGRIRLQRN
jgi:prepilin-type N-terminal cleavage/methylation domain-containing protein